MALVLKKPDRSTEPSAITPRSRTAGKKDPVPEDASPLDMPSSTGEKRTRGAHFQSIGGTGLQHSGGYIREEYLKNLVGPVGMKVIREMIDNDPVIGAIDFATQQAIRQVDWKVIPVDDTDEARKYANFVDSCRMDMNQTWGEVLTEALTFIPFGWSLLEVTYKVRRGYNKDTDRTSRFEDGLVGWQRMAPRSQESMRRWIYDKVNKDKLLAMQQFTMEYGVVDIPIDRCLHFRTRSLKDNPEGRSLYRNAYRPWYMKKRIEEIEGIGIERELSGLPILTAPEGMDLWNPNDPMAVAAKQAAETIVRNIRVDEQMGVLLPFGWDLKLLATGGKKAINTTEIVDRYDNRIAMVVLADFILLGHSNRMGSFALAKSKTSMFAMALVGHLNVLRDTFNSDELPRLWQYNGFPLDKMPRLDYTPVDTPNLRDLASYITALSGAMVDFAPAELQRYLLQLAGIPADLTDLAGLGGTGMGNDPDADPNADPSMDPNNDGEPQARPKVRNPTMAQGRAPTTGRSAQPQRRVQRPLPARKAA